ncbi:MAG TPA: hypothetical protein VHB79_27925 [Polyangiaceae bacterium]|nr:hypothetical protein [Polyangiaceae bacterium]
MGLALASAVAGCVQHGGGEQEIYVSAPVKASQGGASGSDPNEARAAMPAYYDFIQSLQARGFVFMNFGDFWAADKTKLPENLIVIRHDVHHRDIAGAYAMLDVETELLPPRSATYFVMLGFPPEANKGSWQQSYLDLIETLNSGNVDVQPHVSPDDMYLSAFLPSWRKKSRSQLTRYTKGEYKVVQYDDGVEISAVPRDALDIRMLNARVVDLLRQYNQFWTDQTGLTPLYYAAHGTQAALSSVLDNGTLLDQRELIASNVYEFDVYNTRVREWLTYLSDNDEPEWMDHPEAIAPGRYQLLAHPRQWTPKQSEPRLEREEEEEQEAAAGAGGAP